jgi:hypothetical protein
MVTTARIPILRFRTHILTALLVFSCTALCAQYGRIYRVSLKLHVGGPAITGYLHSINDTVVTILPGLGRPVLEAALTRSQPVSIPISLVKKFAVSRVRSIAYSVALGVGLVTGYSVLLAAVIPLDSPVGIFAYVATVTTASVFTAAAINTRKYKPTEPGFTIRMQKFCLVRTGIAADGL